MRLTKEQKAKLLSLYLTEGYYPAAKLAGEYGVSPKMCSKLARKSGYAGNHHLRFKTKPPADRARGWNDPRWARAIAIGVVVA